jgi:ABC-type amino acid transport substrate-binding protein
MAALPGRLRNLLPGLLILAPLAGVYLLPPDTSLGEVRKAGVLRACLPPSYPPLVTGDAAAPGIDVELMQALADGLRVKLIVTFNPAMGRDFNPRSWRLTRAQCELLGGGVVVSPLTRSFLDTSPAYVETGWAFLAPGPSLEPAGRRVGVFTGVSGLDRLALSRHLRAQNAQVVVVQSSEDLVQGLGEGRFDLAVTERLLAGQLAARHGWRVAWAPADLPRYPVALGLWKGDLTLKWAIAGGMERLRRDGALARIVSRYAGTASTAGYAPRMAAASAR